MSRDLNIVTLNVPYPPDYGGMIDSFYRIKWLKNAGINIHLHCFQYGRAQSKELDEYCCSVNYYPRKRSLGYFFSKLPYIVCSRDSKRLLENLNSNNYPILFDGLHTTYYMNHPDLDGRRKFIRTHNIEHLYYKSLSQIEKKIFRRLFYNYESVKLKDYEEKIRENDYGNVKVLTISGADFEYFKGFSQNTLLLPPFHQDEQINSLPGKGNYILYHGDLSVRENSFIAETLAREVFSKIKYNCIIAGKNPPASLKRSVAGLKNVKVISSPDNGEMNDLVKNAHINLLPVMSSNGFKIKYLTALFSGRFCIGNTIAENIFHKDGLIHLADSHDEMINLIKILMNKEFTDDLICKRKQILERDFSNQANTRSLIDAIFN